LTSHEAFEGIQKFFFEEAKVEFDLAADLSDAAILHKMRSEGKELPLWKARHKILEKFSIYKFSIQCILQSTFYMGHNTN
jgi:hypothetical protein